MMWVERAPVISFLCGDNTMPTDSHSDATDAAEERGQNLRRELAAPFSLVELDPHLVLAESAPDSGIMAQEDAVSAGRMRELCPYCGDVPLQLALLSKHVTRPRGCPGFCVNSG